MKKYREENLSKVGMKGIFPIWKRNTSELAHTFIDLGFKAVITCVDSNVLDKRFVGKFYDNQFLNKLPSSVDPCGENGEFHSFVYDGPIFREKIAFTMGDIVLRDNRFYFCDLIPIPKNIPAASDNTSYSAQYVRPNPSDFFFNGNVMQYVFKNN